MGWLRLVGSLKLEVSFAENRLFHRTFLQKRPIILRSLLLVATPYVLYESTGYVIWERSVWVCASERCECSWCMVVRAQLKHMMYGCMVCHPPCIESAIEHMWCMSVWCTHMVYKYMRNTYDTAYTHTPCSESAIEHIWCMCVWCVWYWERHQSYLIDVAFITSQEIV